LVVLASRIAWSAVPSENNLNERMIRHGMVLRKNNQSNRCENGATNAGTIANTDATAAQCLR